MLSSRSGITFQHPTAFWCGSAAVAAGVIAHLPRFFASVAAEHGAHDAAMSELMMVGMILILVGLVLTAYGLIPMDVLRGNRTASSVEHYSAMDDAPMTRQHWALLFVLGVALVVDVMKPATLGFVVPGMRAEY